MSDLERFKALAHALAATRQHILDGKPGVYAPGYDQYDLKWPRPWDISNALYALKNAGAFSCETADEAFDYVEALALPPDSEESLDDWCNKRNKGQVESLLRRVVGQLNGKIQMIERLRGKNEKAQPQVVNQQHKDQEVGNADVRNPGV